MVGIRWINTGAFTGNFNAMFVLPECMVGRCINPATLLEINQVECGPCLNGRIVEALTHVALCSMEERHDNEYNKNKYLAPTAIDVHLLSII